MTQAIEIALFLHLLGITIWIGGMVFAHFCLRPAMADLSPQLRLPLWEGVFSRFFNWVGAAVIVILLSGGFLLSTYGSGAAPWPLHAMAGIGILMMLLFGHIRFALFPRLKRAVQAQDWPGGARTLGSVRHMVVINLVLGVVTIAIAMLAHGM